ncbi:MAG: hypothetical protein KF691_00305 [Phycisphaeraceae bacterium]|nr:hypothetical protein [Phycisphaeraceae bacterium]
MSTNHDNPARQYSSEEVARMLRAIEVESEAVGAEVEAMRRDREELRAALRQDFATPLPARRAAQLSQIVRDEIDRSLLSDLSAGAPLVYHPPDLLRRSPRFGSWRFTRIAAVAATVALVGGIAWLALQRPAVPRQTIVSGTNASGSSPRELPSWAILPERAPNAETPKPALEPRRVARANPEETTQESHSTRDPAIALAWAKRGVLAIRITTDSPGRDLERLEIFAQRHSRDSHWLLSTSAPSGLASIPAHPWPIDMRLADSRDSAMAVRPESATIAGFGLTVRPTTDSLESVRDDLERTLAGAVVFERVDALAAFAQGPIAEPAPESAADVIWWKKPASQWSPRLRLPVLLEFGTPVRDQAK